MGNALIALVVGEEQLPSAGSWRWGTESAGHQYRPPKPEAAEAWWRQGWRAEWEPPVEPDGVLRDPAKRRQHQEAVRASLESYLNAQLARLDGMVRTGPGWVLGRARVTVTLDGE